MTKRSSLFPLIFALVGCVGSFKKESGPDRTPSATPVVKSESYFCQAKDLELFFTFGQPVAELTFRGQKVALTCGTMNVEAAALLRYAFPKADKFAAVCAGSSLSGSFLAGPTNAASVVKMSVALMDKIREKVLGTTTLNCVKKLP